MLGNIQRGKCGSFECWMVFVEVVVVVVVVVVLVEVDAMVKGRDIKIGRG